MKMNFFVRNVSDIVCLRTWNEHFDLKDVLRKMKLSFRMMALTMKPSIS